MAEVRVRVETPMLGLSWHAEVQVERTAFVEAAIREGRLTVIDGGVAEVPVVTVPDEDDGDPDALRGEALDEALRAHGLPLTGRVREKRARLTRHVHQAHDGDEDDDAGAGEAAVGA